MMEWRADAAESSNLRRHFGPTSPRPIALARALGMRMGWSLERLQSCVCRLGDDGPHSCR
jgi:hypothetical protein